jgi:prepilin signal peptidase PulO-like enzyme (type II secretory pathway)
MKDCPACAEPHRVAATRRIFSSELLPFRCNSCGAQLHPKSRLSSLLIQVTLAGTGFAAILALPNYAQAGLFVLLGAAVFMVLQLALPLSVLKKPFTVGPRKKPVQRRSL